MHSADYAVARCLSVRPSVTRRYSSETVKHIIKLFHHVNRHFLHMPVCDMYSFVLPPGEL